MGILYRSLEHSIWSESRSDRFRGLRHNMVSWSYQNKAEVSAAHLRGFQPIGPFWEREQGKAEVWRREGGPEGYGGDNFYAAQQLLRFSRSSLILDKVDTERTAPEIIAPFVSTWSVPTYVNAVSAFLELGFLSNALDRKRLTKHIDSYATGLAAGIYSLCYSMDTSKTSLKVKPLSGSAILIIRAETTSNKAFQPVNKFSFD